MPFTMRQFENVGFLDMWKEYESDFGSDAPLDFLIYTLTQICPFTLLFYSKLLTSSMTHAILDT